MTDRLWPRAIAWLAGCGAFFYVSYPTANWLASLRAHVPVVVFDWERAIPFLPWTIVPYWTTNLFYALSFFLCRDRAELDNHGRRLVTAQVVAVACFIAFPLQMSFAKPATGGMFGFLFEVLGGFDKPFNQAPSLHVALTVILFDLYARVLPRWALPIFAAWSVLVVVSTLTTWQHHFIDLPTGLLLGVLCLWLWPVQGDHRATWRLAQDTQRRALALCYLAGAATLAAIAALLGGAGLWLIWPALSLAAVALAYLAIGPGLFAKSEDGRIDAAAQLLLAPYLAGAWINSRLWTRNEARHVAVADGVLLGRFPSAADCIEVASVVDLTAELARPRGLTRWTSVPMLDLVAPDAAALRRAAEAIEEARRHGPVLVCCALGYGRSVAAVAVWLVRTGRMSDLDAALGHLRAKRPRLALGPAQRQAMTEAVVG
jgi:protein-tyrosine phosphatase/membrane-associated phospholipid phosphatase